MKRVITVLLICVINSVLFGLSNVDFEKKYKTDLEFARITLDEEGVPGYVFFEGFDFKGYRSESQGIEPMLARTLVLLQQYYKSSGQPFVFVGHSQGGLRALAMSTYLKRHDPALYRQLRGVITLSGIDQGLKLLENRGADFRSKLHQDVQILVGGVAGTLKLLDFAPDNPFSDFLLYQLVQGASSEATWILVRYLFGDWLSISSGFGYPILLNRNWDSHAQVRDMVPQSEFIRKYVLAKDTQWHRVQSGSYLAVEWRRGWWGIRYPVLVWRPRYRSVATTITNFQVDKNLPMTFRAGTVSDILDMTEDDGVRRGVRAGITSTGTVFRTAEYLHYAKCAFIIGLFTGSPAASQDCRRATDWCFGFDGEIASLLGGSPHDGLVALESQYLPLSNLQGRLVQYPRLNHATMNGHDQPARQDTKVQVDKLLK